MKFTVLGASGFVGSRLVEALGRQSDVDVVPHNRADPWPPRGPLGHVIYSVGVTGDFVARSADTIEAHVCLLSELVASGEFASLLYLSSTRIYDGARSGAEDADLTARPTDPDHLYNLSKLAGESLCLSDGRPGIRVARLSNVFGAPFDGPNFLDLLVRSTRSHAPVTIRESANTMRDFIDVRDVTSLLPLIATSGRQRVYNVAAGHSVSTGSVVSLLEQHGLDASYDPAPLVPKQFPEIATERVRDEFSFTARDVLEELPTMLKSAEDAT